MTFSAIMRTTRGLFTALLFLIALIGATPQSFADTFRIRVLKGNAPVSGVQIYGNYGVNTLPGRVTNSQGEWELDTSDTASASPTVTYTKYADGLRFEPAETIVNISNCPMHVCTVYAFADGPVQSVVHWQSIDNLGRAVPGIPYMVAGSLLPCTKVTDNEGYVFFAVRKHTAACNDIDADLTNNSYIALGESPAGKSCTFSTMLSNKFKACTAGGDFHGYSTTLCGNTTPASIGSSVTYELFVRDELGRGISGVEFYGSDGVNALPSRITDASGVWRFSTSTLGADPRSTYSIVPTGNYLFYPPEVTLSPNSCPNNRCTFYAVQSDKKQGVIKWNVKQGSSPLGGVRLDAPEVYRCGEKSYKITDTVGEAVFPAILRTSCNDGDQLQDNNSITIDPSYPACTFTHDSSTPFKSCPKNLLSTGEYVAHCGTPEPGHVNVSGYVFSQEGMPLPGAGILRNGVFAASTDNEGAYQIVVSEGSDTSLRVNSASTVYDPQDIQFLKIDRDQRMVNFFAVAPKGVVATPTPCPVKDNYTIQGTVFQANGLPRADAEILNNHQPVAYTNNQGKFSFSVRALSDNWVTAERNDRFFDPAGVALIRMMCDAPEVNFIESPAPSHTLGGKVTDPWGNPLSNVRVQFNYGAATVETFTGSDGHYMVNIADTAEYNITALKDQYTFAPESYNGTATGNKLDLDFVVASMPATPTPTPTPNLEVPFDLSEGFAPSRNPNGPWLYGWSGSIGGMVTPLTVAHTSLADNAVQIPSWQLTSSMPPAVYKNTSSMAITIGKGLASLPAGTVWFYGGANGAPQNYGVIRFTLPNGRDGNYLLDTGVAPVYPSSPQGDCDFHITLNGTPIFSRFLAPADSATYQKVLTLRSGDNVDFIIGRGADNDVSGSGLRISATFTSSTLPASPTPTPTPTMTPVPTPTHPPMLNLPPVPLPSLMPPLPPSCGAFTRLGLPGTSLLGINEQEGVLGSTQFSSSINNSWLKQGRATYWGPSTVKFLRSTTNFNFGGAYDYGTSISSAQVAGGKISSGPAVWRNVNYDEILDQLWALNTNGSIQSMATATVKASNSAGLVVGFINGSATPNNRPDVIERAFVLDLNSRYITYIDPPQGYDRSYGININERGDVVGELSCTGCQQRPGFLWRAGTPLQVIQSPTGYLVRPMDINNLGVIVVNVLTQAGSGISNAIYKYTVENGIFEPVPQSTQIGTPWAHAINDNGTIVGRGADSLGVTGVVWHPVHGAVNLRTLIPEAADCNFVFHDAFDVNNSDILVGYGVQTDFTSVILGGLKYDTNQFGYKINLNDAWKKHAPPPPTPTPSVTPTPTPTLAPIPMPSATPVPTVENKVLICHYPYGNPGQRHTLEVGESAWLAHQDHGDKLGPCEEDPTPQPTNAPGISPTPDPNWTPIPGEEGQIEICHYPPGQPENHHTLRVGISAWPAHLLEHGDTLGPCTDEIPTPFPTPTITPTPPPPGETPTATPTPTSTATPTPEPTPEPRIMLNSVCSEDPKAALRWQIYNPFPFDFELEWDVYASTQKGKVLATHDGYSYFMSITIPQSANTVRLFLGGQQIAVRAASFMECEKPTPTATMTPTPTETPLPVVSPTPTATGTPVTTPTPTPTLQAPTYYIRGELKGRNGRPLKGSFMNKLRNLDPGQMAIAVRASNGTLSKHAIGDPFNFEIPVQRGQYRVSFDNDAGLIVTSRPKKYNLTINDGDQGGVNFAIQFKAKRLGDAFNNSRESARGVR